MLRWLRRRTDGSGSARTVRGGWAFDPGDPDFVRDPYPFFSMLRDEDPVHRTRSGAWILTRYPDVHAALEDPRLGNAPARYAVVHERNRERYTCADVAANILPFRDPPGHTAPRRLVGRAFTDRLRKSPPDVGRIAQEVLEGWDDTSQNVVADYASPLAVAVIADLLGVPREDSPRLEAWSEAFFYLFAAIPSHEIREHLDSALEEFRAYLRPIVADRRAHPSDDLISLLAAPAAEGGSPESEGPTSSSGNAVGLSESEIVDNCMLLFADGLENVDRAIGNAVYALLRHPEQLELLRDEPGFLASAVDECLRFESPAQYIGRIAKEDLELHGVPIKAGSTVLLGLGSANRDPGTFTKPDTLDVTRSPNPHLAFGRGRHSCLGGPLVELQVREALACLLERAPRLELAAAAVDFIPRPGHRWVEEVSVRWSPS